MPIEHDVEQGETAWHMLRAGIPTASRFGKFMKQDFGLRDSEASRGFAMELAAERLIGGPLSMDVDADVMQRGTALETRARAWYELHKDVGARQTGIVMTDDGMVGASPDGLIDDDPEGPGILEMKNPMTKQHVRNLLGAEPATPWQLHGLLWVTERAWCDVLSFTMEPALGPVLVRVRRSDTIMRMITKSVAAFEAIIENYVDRLTLMGKNGRTDDGASELQAQLIASLRTGVDPNPDNLTLDEISDFADDVRRAKKLGVLDEEAAETFLEGATSGDPSETRNHWASLKASLEVQDV